MKNDPEVVERVLSKLRQYGWDLGLTKLREEIAATPDKTDQETLRFFSGWLAAERGAYSEALQLFRECAEVESLAGWVVFGQAFLEMRRNDYPCARQCLIDASRLAGEGKDPLLLAAIEHLHGAILFRQGDLTQSLVHLGKALDGFKTNHFGTGRVLDTFGMVYAGKDNFHAAREFYERAIDYKKLFDDQAGLAVSYGNLGRLYLDWGYLDKAEENFNKDLAIAQNTLDERGVAQMHNFLGQVAIARGEQKAALSKYGEARQDWKDATAFLDSSIRASQTHNWPVPEGYARKDRARLYLAQGNVDEADTEVQAAEALFCKQHFEEGVAHVNRVLGTIRRARVRVQTRARREDFEPAFRAFRAALVHFGKTNEQAEVARTQLEMARTCQAAGEPRPIVKNSYLEALKTAEACRRFELIRQIEEELKNVNFEAYCAHVFHRVRGRDVDDDTTSLITGELRPASVLYLDLKGSTDYALKRSPEEVMMVLNQMMADFVAVLRKHDARVSGFRGDGFLALFLEADHAVRAVRAGLELFEELEQFNEPRGLLDLELFEGRIGIASGDVFLGNVGTYDKMDYTAIGTTANLGARLESAARPKMPCISWQTHDLVRNRFRYSKDSPRTENLRGLGPTQMWDVEGRS